MPEGLRCPYGRGISGHLALPRTPPGCVPLHGECVCGVCAVLHGALRLAAWRAPWPLRLCYSSTSPACMAKCAAIRGHARLGHKLRHAEVRAFEQARRRKARQAHAQCRRHRRRAAPGTAHSRFTREIKQERRTASSALKKINLALSVARPTQKPAGSASVYSGRRTEYTRAGSSQDHGPQSLRSCRASGSAERGSVRFTWLTRPL